MLLFAVVAERLNPSDAHITDSIYKLEPSGSRNSLSLSRCMSEKCLLISILAATPTLITEPFDDWGAGGGCNNFFPVLEGNGTKIVPTGDISDQPPGQMR